MDCKMHGYGILRKADGSLEFEGQFIQGKKGIGRGFVKPTRNGPVYFGEINEGN